MQFHYGFSWIQFRSFTSLYFISPNISQYIDISRGQKKKKKTPEIVYIYGQDTGLVFVSTTACLFIDKHPLQNAT